MKSAGSEARIQEVMTRENLVTAPAETTLEEVIGLPNARVEKLLLVDQSGHLAGPSPARATSRRCAPVPMARMNGDSGLPRRWASINTNGLRHWSGRSGCADRRHRTRPRNVLDTVREVKSNFDIEVIAGNVGIADGQGRSMLVPMPSKWALGLGPSAPPEWSRALASPNHVFGGRPVAEPAGVPVIADGVFVNPVTSAKRLPPGPAA